MNELGFNFQDTLVWPLRHHAPEDISLSSAQALLAEGIELRQPIQGTVFGTLLNDRRALQELGDAVNQDPYKAPPKAPILYIKPRNTHCGHGAPVAVPAGTEGLLAGATLGLVIGQTACRVPESDALSYLAGYTIVNDLSVPHDSFYRPALPCKARDGSCPIGPWIRSPAHIADPDRLAITVRVDGQVRQQANTADLIRPIARLIHDITEFMTLSPGDVVLAGVPAGAPLVRAGEVVSIEIEGLGVLDTPLIPTTQSSRNIV
ncbi:MAG: fumarylacetoacetate hydrolase family protein [Alcaligenaceae bacterium]|nr:fumarylacetoacetate hydrolase family protein [Alcaligenaceae bacterium]